MDIFTLCIYELFEREREISLVLTSMRALHFDYSYGLMWIQDELITLFNFIAAFHAKFEAIDVLKEGE